MILRMSLACVLLVVAGGLALADEPRPRVIVSTDAGGTDYDDLQSLVHLFLHADVIDIEGLVSSPYGPGRARHIHDVIDVYTRDIAALRRRSAGYPDPEMLRRVTVQGAIESAGAAGFGAATAGSRWIVECGRRADPRWVFLHDGTRPAPAARGSHGVPWETRSFPLTISPAAAPRTAPRRWRRRPRESRYQRRRRRFQ
jgi:hypothetical protein